YELNEWGFRPNTLGGQARRSKDQEYLEWSAKGDTWRPRVMRWITWLTRVQGGDGGAWEATW
ncbi:hypothetical protein Tco_1380403, partial [Tanacetum coccineum]